MGTSSFNSTNLLIWLIDGVGLAIIAACTILEGFDIWKDFFGQNFAFNRVSMTFWFTGKVFQVMGLLFLISYAATFQSFYNLEHIGT